MVILFFLIILSYYVNAYNTILFSDQLSIYDGNLGNREVTNIFCQNQPLYLTLKCQQTFLLVDYVEGYGYSAMVYGLNFTNLNASTAIYSKDGNEIALNWYDLFQGTIQNYPNLVEGRVTLTNRYWTGSQNRCVYEGSDWSTNKNCYSGSVNLRPSEFAQCNTKTEVVCVCVNGVILETTTPTTSPTTSGPTVSPSSHPTHSKPTTSPTVSPSFSPSTTPTTSKPTISPSKTPTTSKPTSSPTKPPTAQPTQPPTPDPTPQPTVYQAEFLYFGLTSTSYSASGGAASVQAQAYSQCQAQYGSYAFPMMSDGTNTMQNLLPAYVLNTVAYQTSSKGNFVFGNLGALLGDSNAGHVTLLNTIISSTTATYWTFQDYTGAVFNCPPGGGNGVIGSSGALNWNVYSYAQESCANSYPALCAIPYIVTNIFSVGAFQSYKMMCGGLSAAGYSYNQFTASCTANFGSSAFAFMSDGSNNFIGRHFTDGVSPVLNEYYNILVVNPYNLMSTGTQFYNLIIPVASSVCTTQDFWNGFLDDYTNGAPGACCNAGSGCWTSGSSTVTGRYGNTDTTNDPVNNGGATSACSNQLSFLCIIPIPLYNVD